MEQYFNTDKMRSLTLIITEKCNLSCIYCYEHHKSARNMTFAEAKSILDKELVHLDQYYYTIEFFGGEPFLNLELIKEIVDYVRKNYLGNYHFFATTNGTLIHGEVQDWLESCKDVFTLGLSLDGNKQAHDLNRSNSFDKIDLDFFLKMYPEQTIKMTVSEQSLPYFADSIIFLTEKGFEISCNLAYMVDWFAPQNTTNLQEQLNKLISYYIQHPTVHRCSMLDMPIHVLAHPSTAEGFLRKYCGCKTHILCYDMDGTCYPCQLFSPISAGDKALNSAELNVTETIQKDKFLEECKDCYYQRICPFCLGSNYLSTGDPFQIDKSRCALYKLIFKANALLKALEWDNGTLETDDLEGTLQSIIEINNL